MRSVDHRILAASFALAVTACRPSEEPQAVVEIFATKRPLLALSNYWPLSNIVKQTRQKSNYYEATIPAGKLPVPFVDLNGNGKLERNTEPTGYCVFDNGWACRIEPVRLIIHRLQRPTEDSTLIFADSFDPQSLEKDDTAMLCLANENRCTSSLSSTPYLGGGTVLMLKLCELTNRSDPTAAYAVDLRSGSRVLLTTRATQPPPMNLKTHIRKTNRDTLLVSGTSGLEIHRIVVWVAQLENGATTKIMWSTERNPELVTLAKTEFEARVPSNLLTGCTKCAIGVQVVSDVKVGSVTVSSEGVALHDGEAL